MQEQRQRVGFIGVGAMGSGMAKNILAKGFPLTVLGHRNRAPVEALTQQGAREGKNPADVAHASDIVILCVTGTPQVESIVYGEDGLLGAAREGRLNVMVGANAGVLARLRPVLEAFAENVFHVGGPGTGHKTKLIYNLLALGQVALIAEAVTAGARAGLDLDALCKVVGAGGPNSGIFQSLAPAAIAGRYDGINFGLALACKDLRYFAHMAEQLGLPGFVAPAVYQSFMVASALGFGGEKVGALIKAMKGLTGTSAGRR